MIRRLPHIYAVPLIIFLCLPITISSGEETESVTFKYAPIDKSVVTLKFNSKKEKVIEGLDRRDIDLSESSNRSRVERTDNGCESDATHYPLPITQVKDSSSVEDCPHQKIIELYHSQLPQLRKIKVWSDKRQKALRTRWKENPKHQSLEFWERLFSYVARSDFLTGKKGEWQADLEWIINPTNFIKIIEGKYDA